MNGGSPVVPYVTLIRTNIRHIPHGQRMGKARSRLLMPIEVYTDFCSIVSLRLDISFTLVSDQRYAVCPEYLCWPTFVPTNPLRTK